MKHLRGIYVIFLLLGGMMLAMGLWNSPSAEKIEAQETEAYEVMRPKTVEVILQRVYLDGEMSEEKIQETIEAMEDFWRLYDDWTLIDQNEKQIIFRQEVEDLSPLLKINGYFGLTEDDILSIFEGKPQEENIIQSFFQIDTAKLKSAQHEQLRNGIRVENLTNYQEVIQVFKEYKTENGAF